MRTDRTMPILRAAAALACALLVLAVTAPPAAAQQGVRDMVEGSHIAARGTVVETTDRELYQIVRLKISDMVKFDVAGESEAGITHVWYFNATSVTGVRPVAAGEELLVFLKDTSVLPNRAGRELPGGLRFLAQAGALGTTRITGAPDSEERREAVRLVELARAVADAEEAAASADPDVRAAALNVLAAKLVRAVLEGEALLVRAAAADLSRLRGWRADGPTRAALLERFADLPRGDRRRADVADVLGVLEVDGAASLLTDALRDDPGVSATTVGRNLARLGDGARELAALMQEEEPGVRARAYRAAAAAGLPRAVAGLAPAVAAETDRLAETDDPDRRAAVRDALVDALESLGSARAGGDGGGVFAAVRPLLEHDDPAVRRAAVVAAARSADPAAAGALGRMRDDADPHMRAFIERVLRNPRGRHPVHGER